VALRPRLSPGVPLSKMSLCTVRYRRCQAELCLNRASAFSVEELPSENVVQAVVQRWWE
jgi:hypothetical protein